MRQLWVDFNAVDRHGQTTTLASFAEPGVELALGNHVLVGDDEGNLCDALITDMGKDGSVVVALDLGTFRYDEKAARIAV